MDFTINEGNLKKKRQTPQAVDGSEESLKNGDRKGGMSFTCYFLLEICKSRHRAGLSHISIVADGDWLPDLF